MTIRLLFNDIAGGKTVVEFRRVDNLMSLMLYIICDTILFHVDFKISIQNRITLFPKTARAIISKL